MANQIFINIRDTGVPSNLQWTTRAMAPYFPRRKLCKVGQLISRKDFVQFCDHPYKLLYIKCRTNQIFKFIDDDDDKR